MGKRERKNEVIGGRGKWVKEGVEWQEGKGRWERMEVGKGRKREKETRENEGKRKWEKE